MFARQFSSNTLIEHLARSILICPLNCFTNPSSNTNKNSALPLSMKQTLRRLRNSKQQQQQRIKTMITNKPKGIHFNRVKHPTNENWKDRGRGQATAIQRKITEHLKMKLMGM